jgi:hypothetical protein
VGKPRNRGIIEIEREPHGFISLQPRQLRRLALDIGGITVVLDRRFDQSGRGKFRLKTAENLGGDLGEA